MTRYLRAVRILTSAAGLLTILAQFLHGATARDWLSGAILAVSSGLLMAAFYAVGQARGLALGERERLEVLDTLHEATLTMGTAQHVLRFAWRELEKHGAAELPPDPNTLT